MAPAAAGALFTVMGKFAEATPLPHAFTPRTVRTPEVADEEKVANIDAVVPDALNPVPVYDQE